MKTRSRRSPAVVAAAVILVVALGLGSFAYNEGLPPFAPTGDEWSGVFLTNGQAYFGHFYSAPGEYAKLREVYYVLSTQLQSQDPKVPSQTQLSLQKLGGEWMMQEERPLSSMAGSPAASVATPQVPVSVPVEEESAEDDQNMAHAMLEAVVTAAKAWA